MDTILITGGLGRIGQSLSKNLRGVYRTRSFDLRPSPEADENSVGNITDIDALVDACRGVCAIVHLAGIPTEAPFDLLLDTNIRGTYCVYEAARRAGVERVVFASTNHVTGMWERDGVFVTPDMPVRPDSLYGVSKASGEAIARYFADAYGVRSVCLRIGGFSANGEFGAGRGLWMTITAKDMTQLVDKSIRTDALFAVVNGLSDNPKAQGDLSSAREWLHYAPEDRADDALDAKTPEERKAYEDLRWRSLTRSQMMREWAHGMPNDD